MFVYISRVRRPDWLVNYKGDGSGYNSLFLFSFRDETDSEAYGDLDLLAGGICLVIAYVAVILGRFNETEHKVTQKIAWYFAMQPYIVLRLHTCYWFVIQQT